MRAIESNRGMVVYGDWCTRKWVIQNDRKWLLEIAYYPETKMYLKRHLSGYLSESDYRRIFNLIYSARSNLIEHNLDGTEWEFRMYAPDGQLMQHFQKPAMDRNTTFADIAEILEKQLITIAENHLYDRAEDHVSFQDESMMEKTARLGDFLQSGFRYLFALKGNEKLEAEFFRIFVDDDKIVLSKENIENENAVLDIYNEIAKEINKYDTGITLEIK